MHYRDFSAARAGTRSSAFIRSASRVRADRRARLMPTGSGSVNRRVSGEAALRAAPPPQQISFDHLRPRQVVAAPCGPRRRPGQRSQWARTVRLMVRPLLYQPARRAEVVDGPRGQRQAAVVDKRADVPGALLIFVKRFQRQSGSPRLCPFLSRRQIKLQACGEPAVGQFAQPAAVDEFDQLPARRLRLGPPTDVYSRCVADLPGHGRPGGLPHGGETALVVRRKGGLLYAEVRCGFTITARPPACPGRRRGQGAFVGELLAHPLTTRSAAASSSRSAYIPANSLASISSRSSSSARRAVIRSRSSGSSMHRILEGHPVAVGGVPAPPPQRRHNTTSLPPKHRPYA